MTDTKENILMSALRLFARDGYEAVSVSKIAGELGMTKGALYKHYKNKRDIFDSIVARIFQLDQQRAQEYGVPVDVFHDDPGQYQHLELENIKEFTIAQYRFWTTDEFTSNLRKMLVLEQYRNPEMNELYHNCIVSGPVQYMEDIFREMIARGILKENDPGQLAIEYFAPMFLLIAMFDGNLGNEGAETRLAVHIDRFMETNVNK